ncbi:MAG: MFS transporter [Acetobacteraceae bacterium]
MTNATALPGDPEATAGAGRPRWLVVSALGICQILAWGSTYYLPSVLAVPIARATGWPAAWVVGGLSVGLLVSGLVSPMVGRTIDRVGGRPVLAASAGLVAVGLLGLALAPSLPVYVAAWMVIGLGMGCGLYDPVFSTLGHLYGNAAGPLITGVTLWGGFASTLCWPLSAFLTEHLGWRGACFTYAALNLLIVLPLYAFGLPGRSPQPLHIPLPRSAAAHAPGSRRSARAAFWLVAAALTLAAVLMTIVSVELITILQARGLSLASAVALGTLLGPSQVGARVVQFAVGRRGHPIWTMLAATVLVALGLGGLLLNPAFFAGGLILQGAGRGIQSIARATVPLALFGPDGYATLMGRIAMPSLIAQALAPTVGALLVSDLGPIDTVGVLLALGVANLIPVLMLVPISRRGGLVQSRA